MATSAAPTYFPAFRCTDNRLFWDGGLWANDPTLVGIVEATGEMGIPLNSIEILSIGTTRTLQDGTSAAKRGGAINLVSLLRRKLLEVVGTLSERSALEMGSLLVGQKQVVRIDELVAGTGFDLDDARPETLATLETCASAAVTNLPEESRNRFFSTRVPPFIPVPWPPTSQKA